MPTPKPKTVDEYLAAIPSPEQKQALINLRKTIRDQAPQAQELISYGIPTYKQSGFVASFAAFKSHCSFFPGHTVSQFENELKDFKIQKGTIRFTPDRPIPEPLVRAILRARIAENQHQP